MVVRIYLMTFPSRWWIMVQWRSLLAHIAYFRILDPSCTRWWRRLALRPHVSFNRWHLMLVQGFTGNRVCFEDFANYCYYYYIIVFWLLNLWLCVIDDTRCQTGCCSLGRCIIFSASVHVAHTRSVMHARPKGILWVASCLGIFTLKGRCGPKIVFHFIA